MSGGGGGGGEGGGQGTAWTRTAKDREKLESGRELIPAEEGRSLEYLKIAHTRDLKAIPAITQPYVRSALYSTIKLVDCLLA